MLMEMKSLIQLVLLRNFSCQYIPDPGEGSENKKNLSLFPELLTTFKAK